MKNFKIIPAIIIMTMFLMTSCQEDVSNSETTISPKVDINTNKIIDADVIIDYIQITKTEDHVEDYFLTIGLGARIYKLSKKDENIDMYLEIIEKSSHSKQPLKATFNKETQFLLDLETPSVEETKEWERNYKFLWDGKGSSDTQELKLDDIENYKSTSVDFSNYTEISNAFNYLKNNSCDSNPYSTQYGCISFAFKTDGCYARAHRMRQLLESAYNKTCYKMFVYANIASGQSLNIPGCSFGWSYHVAPLVRNSQNGIWYVLDPSLSNYPLTRSSWIAIMGSNNVCDTEYYNNAAYFPTNQGCGYHNYATDSNYNSTYSTLWNYQNVYGCAAIP